MASRASGRCRSASETSGVIPACSPSFSRCCSSSLRARDRSRASGSAPSRPSCCSPRLAAFLMSLGPEIRSGGRLISEVGPYHFFYWHVPGLRRPARAGAVRDARHAVSVDCRGTRRRRDRTAVPPRRRHRRGARRACRRRSVRRAHRHQRHGRRRSLRDAAGARLYRRRGAGRRIAF